MRGIGSWIGGAALLALALAGTGTAQAKPKGKTQIEFQVKPATALLFIDDKPQGKVGTSRLVDVTPGFHVVKVTNKGDEHEERIKVAPSEKTTYSFEFDEGAPTTPEGGPAPIPEEEEKRIDPFK